MLLAVVAVAAVVPVALDPNFLLMFIPPIPPLRGGGANDLPNLALFFGRALEGG